MDFRECVNEADVRVLEHAVVTHSGGGRAFSVPVPYPDILQPTAVGIGDLLLWASVAQGVLLTILACRVVLGQLTHKF